MHQLSTHRSDIWPCTNLKICCYQSPKFLACLKQINKETSNDVTEQPLMLSWSSMDSSKTSVHLFGQIFTLLAFGCSVPIWNTRILSAMWFINTLDAFSWADRRKFLCVPDRDCTDKPKKVQPGEAVSLLGPLQEQEWLRGTGTSENPEAPSVPEGPPANRLPRVNSTRESHPSWLFTSYRTWGAQGSPEKRVPLPPRRYINWRDRCGRSQLPCFQTAKLRSHCEETATEQSIFLQTIRVFSIPSHNPCKQKFFLFDDVLCNIFSVFCTFTVIAEKSSLSLCL